MVLVADSYSGHPAIGESSYLQPPRMCVHEKCSHVAHEFEIFTIGS